MTDNAQLRILHIRRGLCRTFISILDRMDDEEVIRLGETPETRRSALEEYKRQLAEIDAQITAITGTPPPVVVNLKTARLFGHSDNLH